VSAVLRAREELAIARIAAALDFPLNTTRLRADELEEMADRAEARREQFDRAASAEAEADAEEGAES
jgi:hypothetical protein